MCTWSFYNIYNVLSYFQNQGIDISKTKVYCSNHPGKVLKIDFHKSKDYPQFYELNAKDLCNSYSAHMRKVVKDIIVELKAYKEISFQMFFILRIFLWVQI